MAVNGDQTLYFYNGLYDDDIISNKLADYQNHMYDPIIRGKAWIQNNRIINGDIMDIHVNQKLNLRFGMPMNTYSIFLNINIVPFYSEKEFYFKYGYETPITTSQIMEDDKIFSKYIYFFMSGYLVHDIELVVLKGGHTIIFIHPTEGDKTGDVHEKDLNAIMDSDDEDILWTIMFSTRSDVYKVKQQRAMLFTDNKIYLSSIPQYKKYNRPSKNNCYTLYMSAFPTSYNIMSACSVSVGEDEQGEYFLVPQEFKDYIYARTNLISCMIFNEPDCSGTGIYVDSEVTEPIFQIPYEKNPIPISNLLVWAFDSKTNRKLHPLEQKVIIHYPNVYDFSEMIEESYYTYLCDKSKAYLVDPNNIYFILGGRDGNPNYDLFIEWIEPTEDCMEFHSYIQDYIEYNKNYCEMISSNTLPEEFNNFDPISYIPLGALDYYRSEFYGDYRGWRLDCISKILHNNPKKYEDFYHEIYYKIRYYLTRCYNYTDEPAIYDREVMDNHEHCKGDNENKITFTTPHAFLHVYDYQETLMPMNVFIGGKLSKIEFAFKRGQRSYIYIDKELLGDHQSIQLDMDLVDRITESAKINFNAAGSAVDLENLNFKEKHSLSNLILADKDGNYIDIDDFELNCQIVEKDVSFNGDDQSDTALYEYEDFYTSDEELFVPLGSDAFVVRSAEIESVIENTNSSKEIDIDTIKIKPKDEKYNGSSIYIGTTDFTIRKTFVFSDSLDEVYLYDADGCPFMTDSLEFFMLPREGTPEEDGVEWLESYDAVFKQFRGKPSLDRFKVYLDGKIVSPDTYEVEFTGFSKDAIFHFDDNFINKRIDIHYSSFDDELIYDGDIVDLVKNPQYKILFLSDILETPYDPFVYKMFIDGYRVSDDKLHMLGQNNIIFTDQLWDENSTIMIYRQKMDDEIYGYTQDTQFLDKTAQNDPEFLQFLYDKYVLKKSSQ